MFIFVIICFFEDIMIYIILLYYSFNCGKIVSLVVNLKGKLYSECGISLVGDKYWGICQLFSQL